MNIFSNIWILPSVFFISLILNKLLINIAYKINLIDKPNYRSLHKVDKPRAGGIAIFLSFIFGVLIVDINISFYLFIAFLIVFLLGIFDDIKNLSSKTKFLFLMISATFLYLDGYYIQSLGTFAGYDFYMIPIFSYIFLLFAAVGFINATNLIDGLDGLSSGIGIVILISFTYIGFKFSDSFLFFISLILVFSLF